MAVLPMIPQKITVHLGCPNSDASNVTVPFIDYIKNVAACEIFPVWPINSLKANIYAEVTFALNRIFTGWYRNKGFDFDITNSTSFDQAYTYGRNTFCSINNIVDELFDDYVRRSGMIEPYFTQYCNGLTDNCEGLSKWGTVSLAMQGLTPYEILQRYYGPNIEIVRNAPIKDNKDCYPGITLKRGCGGNAVRIIQTKLNRISVNYSAIPKIANVNSVFDKDTEDAVKCFQQLFNLPPDGVVDKGTWYKIIQIYDAVIKPCELYSVGLTLCNESRQFTDAIKENNSGMKVRLIQYYLDTISLVNPCIQFIRIDDIFGPSTVNSVKAFQSRYNLTPDGVVGRKTWNQLANVYSGIIEKLPETIPELRCELFSENILSNSDSGESVEILQFYLSVIADFYPIAKVSVDGKYGPITTQAILDFQKEIGIPQTGDVKDETWNRIVNVYSDIISHGVIQEGQYPGVVLSEGVQ